MDRARSDGADLSGRSAQDLRQIEKKKGIGNSRGNGRWGRVNPGESTVGGEGGGVFRLASVTRKQTVCGDHEIQPQCGHKEF